MREQPDFSAEIDRAASSSKTAKVDSIDRRTCESEKYNGSEYTIRGSYVPIRPIVEIFADKDGFAIQFLSMSNEQEEPCLKVFVADLRRDSSKNPSFT